MTTWCDYPSLSFLGKENSHNDYHFCFSDDDIIYSLTATYKHLFLNDIFQASSAKKQIVAISESRYNENE